MKSYTCIFLFLFILTPAVFAQRVKGLKQEVAMRYMGYIHMPSSRDKFNTFGQYRKYKEVQKKRIRSRLNPRLNELREKLANFKNQSLVTLAEFDPTQDYIVLTKDNFDELNTLDYPKNIRVMLPQSETFIDSEMISFSLYGKPDLQQFQTLYKTVEGIFQEARKVEPPKKRFRNDRERELYEPIKYKEYSFFQYEPFFGLYLGGDILVDSDYMVDLNGVINSRFIKTFREFKTRYFSSKETFKQLVTEKIVVDIQTIIQRQKYSSLTKPFEVSKARIPEEVIRLEEKINELDMMLIVGVNAEKRNPKNEKIISEFFQHSVKKTNQ